MRKSVVVESAVALLVLVLGILAVASVAATGAPVAASPVVSSDAHTVYDINAVRFETSAADKSVRSGDDAHKIFCTCPDELSEVPTMCDTVTHQCRQTFCTPVCLRMAWTPIIEVDCSRAPSWSWCEVFASQVAAAQSAVTAQFQAHVCLDSHFCNRTEAVIDWIENANFGKHYPEHKLPIASCRDEEASADVRDALCTGCERVLSVRLQMNSCIPANSATGFETMQAGSLQERCLYVRDHIGVHEHDLLTQFRERVCPCLGCCGDRQCYFPNVEHQWLTNLIESVQHKVTSQLADAGWLNPDGTSPEEFKRKRAAPARPAAAAAAAGAKRP